MFQITERNTNCTVSVSAECFFLQSVMVTVQYQYLQIYVLKRISKCTVTAECFLYRLEYNSNWTVSVSPDFFLQSLMVTVQYLQNVSVQYQYLQDVYFLQRGLATVPWLQFPPGWVTRPSWREGRSGSNWPASYSRLDK
jgi:hypothetical protein